MATLDEYILIFRDTLSREIEAENYAEKLATLLSETENHDLELVKEIIRDEIKHQAIVRQVLKVLH